MPTLPKKFFVQTALFPASAPMNTSNEKIKKEIANEEKRRKAKERINERKARIRR